MASFEEKIQNHLDDRARTLARIKTRSVGADTPTLTALSVLVYAQLEGGVKDLAACVIKDLNILRPNIGRIRPKLLVWRNPEEIDKFKARVDFDMIAAASPFASALAVPFQLKPINQRYELNQMDWKAIGKVYTGLGLDHAEINKLRTKSTKSLTPQPGSPPRRFAGNGGHQHGEAGAGKGRCSGNRPDKPLPSTAPIFFKCSAREIVRASGLRPSDRPRPFGEWPRSRVPMSRKSGETWGMPGMTSQNQPPRKFQGGHEPI